MIVIMILEYDNIRAARHASNTLKIKHCHFREFLSTYAFIMQMEH